MRGKSLTGLAILETMERRILVIAALWLTGLPVWLMAQAGRRPEAAPLKPGQFDWNPDRAKAGPLVVIVSLPDQQAYVYRNGIRIGRTSASTGRPGHATPTGVFTILQKDKDHHSSIYNNAPMPYMERLTWGGVALHAGNLPGYPASHGCVRLPLEFSKLLFGVTEMSTTVVIADRCSADPSTLHPGLLLASAHLEKNPALMTLPEPPGESVWTPDAAPTGPVSILLSGADRTVYVQRNGVLIGRAGVSIIQPERPLAPGVFIMLESTSNADNAFVPGRPNRLWQAVSLANGSGQLTTHDLINRVRMPPAFALQVYEILVPGSTLMVTDRTATGFTATPADFAVMATDIPGAKK